MRKRSLLATAAVLGAAALPGVAAAEPGGDAGPPLDVPAAADEVTLPTGQTVRFAEDGALVLDSEEAFVASKTSDGERIVMPLDAADDIAAGEYEAEAFNVDALAAGEEVPEDEPEEPSGIEVTFTGRWLDGSEPAQTQVEWVNLATGERSGVELVEGDTVDLVMEPGRYQFVSLLYKDIEANADVIAGIEQTRISEHRTEVVLDGSEAEPLGFDLDRDDAVVNGLVFDLFSYAPGTQEGAWAGLLGALDGQLYAVPTDRLSHRRNAGFVLREGFANPAGAEDAYSYSLFRAETDGIPRDLVERVHDEELARIDTEYQSLGAETVLNRQDLSDHPIYDAWGYASTGPVALPSSRTEYYTADADVSWSHRGWFPYEGGPGSAWDLVHHDSGPLEAGSVQQSAWNNAPLSVGLDDIGGEWPPAMVTRWDELGALYAAPWMFSTVDGGEGIQSDYLPGKITLARNGEIIGQNNVVGLGVPLESVEAGRLSLTVDTAREASWTPLGTASSAVWEFDYDPEGNPIQPVSVVNFKASGVENGYAEAGTVQEIALEFATQPGADDQACAAMTFEVSFDDGATWQEIAIDRDGDTATAQLELPDEPGFVSVRFTAADEAGNTVEHETIRSYGLR